MTDAMSKLNPAPARPRRHFLRDIQLDELSLVDEPANPGAVVTLFKRHDPDAIEPAPLAKALEAIPTPAPATSTMKGSPPMSHSEKLLKAAHAGLHQYGNKSDWKGALHELAQSKARKGETVEAAVSRLLADRDTDMMALIRAERAAEPAAPVAKVAANPPPSALDNLAKARAAETGEDFFTAFSKVADTPEGRRLWAESRRA